MNCDLEESSGNRLQAIRIMALACEPHSLKTGGISDGSSEGLRRVEPYEYCRYAYFQDVFMATKM